MAQSRVNPTRMELTKLKRRLKTASRGHKLLKDKCDELMKQFLTVVKENMELRIKVEKALSEVNDSFALASAATSDKVLEESLMLPKKSVRVDAETKNIMSVNVPVIHFDNEKNKKDLFAYGFAFTSGELDSSLIKLNEVLPDLILLAEKEKASQLLAAEIERTRRRVNALEYMMIPNIESSIHSITMKLDENERGNTTRLMKVKDMMLEKSRMQK